MNYLGELMFGKLFSHNNFTRNRVQNAFFWYWNLRGQRFYLIIECILKQIKTHVHLNVTVYLNIKFYYLTIIPLQRVGDDTFCRSIFVIPTNFFDMIHLLSSLVHFHLLRLVGWTCLCGAKDVSDIKHNTKWINM